MKYEWRKVEKDFYLPKPIPTLIEIPTMKFFTVSGKGNPNTSPDFAEGIGALYSLSYGIKMMPKGGTTPKGYFEYTVYPLEGVWDLTEPPKDMSGIEKEKLVYDLMIRQPDFVTKELAMIS